MSCGLTGRNIRTPENPLDRLQRWLTGSVEKSLTYTLWLWKQALTEGF